jgi:hypothetical protein
MNAAPPRLIAVHPERMLTVTLRYPAQDFQVNAIGCRYIATRVAAVAHPVVAIEVIHDRMTPMPILAYECYAHDLEVIVLPANALVQVRPYLLYPPGPDDGEGEPHRRRYPFE